MTVSTDAIRFPTSDTPHTGGGNEFRDATVTRAAMSAHDVVDRVAGAVGPAVDKIKDTAARATDLLRMQDLRLDEFQDRTLASVRTAVRKRPATSVAVALALGWMIGRAFSR